MFILYMTEVTRKAYVLTTDFNSPRTIFSSNVLKRVGFEVCLVQHIPHQNKVISNKISMQNIYRMIVNGDDEYAYVFENDINIMEEIRLPEIVQYEPLSKMFFYLGMCSNGAEPVWMDEKVEGYPVATVGRGSRGLHAIGISKYGAHELLVFSLVSKYTYMDMILEVFATKYTPPVVRYDLVSPHHIGHFGVFYQDRDQFESEISNSGIQLERKPDVVKENQPECELDAVKENQPECELDAVKENQSECEPEVVK